ncbi:Multiple epidermal growth factor-like domains protein [Trichinella pseudospiralis]
MGELNGSQKGIGAGVGVIQVLAAVAYKDVEDECGEDEEDDDEEEEEEEEEEAIVACCKTGMYRDNDISVCVFVCYCNSANISGPSFQYRTV